MSLDGNEEDSTKMSQERGPTYYEKQKLSLSCVQKEKRKILLSDIAEQVPASPGTLIYVPPLKKGNSNKIPVRWFIQVLSSNYEYLGSDGKLIRGSHQRLTNW